MTTEQENTPPKNFGFLNIILIIGLSVLLCGEGYFGYRLYALSSRQEQIKEDYSTINNITFGLFSVDQWRDKMAAVVSSQVSDFKMTRAQKKELQAQVEQELHGLIKKTFAAFNKPQKTFLGKVKKFAVNKFVDPEQIQAQVPAFSKTIVDKVSSPASIRRLKGMATSKIDQLEKETYDSTETATAAVDSYMYKKYHVGNAAQFDKVVNNQLTDIRMVTYNYSFAMLGCVLVALGLWWLMRNEVHLQTTLFIMSLLFALILLAVGTTTSIIEVDARLQTLNFTLMGQNVAFENQVLFFQSQSIIGIISVLLRQSKPDAIVVGSLIMLFVVILPVLRILAKGIHRLSNETFAQNKVLQYLVFDSAHWDMSDVMVVGILMTYIGLNGILKSQLTNLNIHNSFITTATVNYTSLQPGYFIFVGYVAFAVILAAVLKRIIPHGGPGQVKV